MSKQNNPVNWFEIPVKNMDRAQEFYEQVLNTKLQPNTMDKFKMAWFPMDFESPGATGSLIQGEGYTPSHQGSMVYFSVKDIEGTLKKVEEKGGKTLMPKMSIGEHGFIAHFEDCEGNRVSLHSAN